MSARHRVRRADLAQAGGGRVAHVDVLVAERGDQRAHGALVAVTSRASRRRSCAPPRRRPSAARSAPARRPAEPDVDLHGGVAHGRRSRRRAAPPRGPAGASRPGRPRAARPPPGARPALVGHRERAAARWPRGSAESPSSATARRRAGLLAPPQGRRAAGGAVEVAGWSLHLKTGDEPRRGSRPAGRGWPWPSTSPRTVARLSRAISEMFSMAFTTSSPPVFCSAVAYETCCVMRFMFSTARTIWRLPSACSLVAMLTWDGDLVHVLDREAHLAAARGLLPRRVGGLGHDLLDVLHRRADLLAALGLLAHGRSPALVAAFMSRHGVEHLGRGLRLLAGRVGDLAHQLARSATPTR